MENNNKASDSDSTDIESLSDDDTDNAKYIKNRKKRDIAWCGVEDETSTSSASALKITWPPSNPHSNWRQLRHVHFGNFQFGTKMQLFSKTRQHLAIYPDGVVRGTPDDHDLHTFLEVASAGHPGHVRIKGLLTNLYVAMDHKGRLYGESDVMSDAAVFIEAFQGSYNTYLSLKYAHLGWYLGIKKSGKYKRGPKTSHRQKAILFLPRRGFTMQGEADWSGNQMQLFSQTGYNLTIRQNGLVLGTQNGADPDSLIQITSAGDVAIVRIQGLQSQLYLCFDSNGNLYGEENPGLDGTIFEEHFQGSYSGFRSITYTDWYVGIKKSGTAKNGKRTKYGQKAVKFLPRRLN